MTGKTRLFTGLIALIGAAAVAGSAIATTPKATLTIRHQARGCHAWSYNAGPYAASLKITLPRGTTLNVIDNDVMPHKLVQLAAHRRG